MGTSIIVSSVTVRLKNCIAIHLCNSLFILNFALETYDPL